MAGTRTEVAREKTLMGRLEDIPEYVVYLFLAIILIAPLLRPIGLPIPITKETRVFFQAIDALKPGDSVFFVFDGLSMTWMEQGLGTTVAIQHLLMKPGVRIVAASGTTEGPIFWEQMLKSLGGIEAYGKAYGRDVVYLGYLSGGVTMEAALAADIAKTTSMYDHYDRHFSTLPLMSEVNNVHDFRLLFCLSSGSSYDSWLNQWVMPYGIPYYVVPLAGVATEVWRRMEQGLVQSMIVGARGAAEYEILLGKPGRACAGMDAQSLGHIYVILLVFVGNIAFVYNKRRRPEEKVK